MVVKYDSLNRFETPKLTLCSPGSIYNNGLLTNVVGMLIDTEAEEIVFNFNSTSELNFRVNRIHRESNEENTYAYTLYKAIQNRRLLFVDDVGYFMITNVEDGFDGTISYKDITAKSIDNEIAQKMVPYIPNGTYRFTTDETETNKGILETIVETLPLWSIGEIDETVATKWRTFEDIDTSLNCLGFLLDNVQDAYECIIVFDCIHRIINVYAQDNYVRQTNIHITKDDLINSLNITENADDLYTAINVLGDENITISAINPLGTNVIYNFDYYLEWMSTELSEKVAAWQQAVKNAKKPYYDLNLEYYNLLAEASELQLEISMLDTQTKMYSRCRDNIVAESGTGIVSSYNTVITENGGTAITIHEEIADTLADIDNLIAACEANRDNAVASLDNVNISLVDYRTSIEEITNGLVISNYFTEDEHKELLHYIFEGSYTDDYVVFTDIMTYEEKFEQMKILYDRAEFRLERMSQPTQEFNIDVENFIFAKEFAQWSEQLETGCLINVELNLNDITQLFLSNIIVNYDDHSLSMTFGNRFNKFDPKSLFNNMLGDISKTANTLNYIKEILYPIKNGEFNEVQEALQTSRNLTMGAALSSSGEEIIIDGSGYTGRRLLEDGTFDPKQVKLISTNLVFTDDAWEHCKVALGELLFDNGSSAYGINAGTIIGDVIIGNNLRILDNEGNDLFVVMDNKVKSSVENVVYGDENQLQPDGSDSVIKKISTIEQTADGISMIISEITTTEEDESGNTVHSVGKVKTSAGYIFDNAGLTISKAGEEITNLLDHSGMYVKRSDEDILTANHKGVNAINLTAKQYLTIGKNSRFEDYSNSVDTRRTACYYIGNDNEATTEE